jgi:DNA-binding CsgD family transcriptional regulator
MMRCVTSAAGSSRSRRLVRGERVPTIARDLFLGQSTVRNHLSAMYRKVGVRSQPELLARLASLDRIRV